MSFHGRKQAGALHTRGSLLPVFIFYTDDYAVKMSCVYLFFLTVRAAVPAMTLAKRRITAV